MAFADTLGADGSFQVHTNLGPPPTKANVSGAAGVSPSSWQYILSFGGQNAAGPTVSDPDAYASGFLGTYAEVKGQYGFDGIDIDIETGMATPLLTAFRAVFKQLHKDGQVISMAPQPLNINPQEVKVFSEGSFNAYVPLVDTTMIDTVTYIAPQLYNNPMPLNDLEKYVTSLQQGLEIDWAGQKLKVNIPPGKLVFGYPATSGAAPAGPSQSWELPASSLAAHYAASSTLLGTGGCMTWSIGWDASAGWGWVTAVKGIWK